VYEAFKLIYDSGYLISASGFEKNEATATECGMQGVFALIYDEDAYIWGKNSAGKFGNKILARRIRSAIILISV